MEYRGHRNRVIYWDLFSPNLTYKQEITYLELPACVIANCKCNVEAILVKSTVITVYLTKTTQCIGL